MHLISWIHPRGSETVRNYNVIKAHILSGNSNVHTRINAHVQAYVPDHVHVHDCVWSFHLYFSFRLFMLMQHVHSTYSCSMDMQDGHEEWTCSMDMQHDIQCGDMDMNCGHAAWKSSMDKQHRHAAWSINMKHGYAACHTEWTCKMEMLPGQATWTCSIDK